MYGLYLGCNSFRLCVVLFPLTWYVISICLFCYFRPHIVLFSLLWCVFTQTIYVTHTNISYHLYQHDISFLPKLYYPIRGFINKKGATKHQFCHTLYLCFLVVYYSHSIVAGGFELISYVTLFTPLTLLMMSLDTFARKS